MAKATAKSDHGVVGPAAASSITAMLTPTDIAEYGEKHVELWLRANNYQCHRAPATSHSHGHYSHVNHNAIDLEARTPENTMMVHVRTAMAPRRPHELTENEQHGICARAIMLGYDAWLAQVQIDNQGELAEDIQWTKLV
jgi:hypothetical protein